MDHKPWSGLTICGRSRSILPRLDLAATGSTGTQHTHHVFTMFLPAARPHYCTSLPSNNVEVDNDGLHLYIRPVADSPVNGEYASSEIINMNPLGYGTYLIQVRGAINRQDPVSVLGLFTWDTEGGAVAAPYRELDFEFSRWGNAADTTVGQFVVQPHGDAGNLQRFPLEGTT